MFSTVLAVTVLLLLNSVMLLFLAFSLTCCLKSMLSGLPLNFNVVTLTILLLTIVFCSGHGHVIVRPVTHFVAHLVVARRGSGT